MTGRRIALVVATDEYDDTTLQRLAGPQKDAAALVGVLSDEDLGGFEVTVSHNRPNHELALLIEDVLADRSSDDAVLLHFSCHGLKNDSGELVLATKNAKVIKLAAAPLSTPWLSTLMHRS